MRRSDRNRRTGWPLVRTPRPVLQTVGAVLAFVLLAGVALAILAVVDQNRDSEQDSVAAAALRWGLLLLALFLVYFFLVSLRRCLLTWQAVRPGSIDIDIDHPTDLRNALIADLREALTSVQLAGTSVVPGAASPSNGLDDVHTVAVRAETWWAALAAVFVPLLPRSAYRVSLVVRSGPADQRKGLTVEVSSQVSRDVSVATVWDETWEAVARRAACHVAAYVLPRTRLADRPPWTPWRGVELDPDLFYHVQEARRLARRQRPEEALAHFDRAIDMDKLNSYLRIEKAMVLDQLGLYIDALATYVDVVTIESRYDRKTWDRYREIMKDDPKRRHTPPHFDRSPNGPAALQYARYRMMCSLSASHRLVDQLCRHARGPDRDGWQGRRHDEATRVIARLKPLLVPFGLAMLDSHEVFADELLKQGVQEHQEELLRRIAQYAALQEACWLDEDYGRRLRSRLLPFSRAAIRVLPLWAALQYRYVVISQRRAETEPWMLGKARFVSKTEPTRITKELGSGQDEWPLRPKSIVTLVDKALGKSRGWLANYNAACAYAVSVLTPDILPVAPAGTSQSPRGHDAKATKRHLELVRLAIDRLARAVVATDSQFAAGDSLWLRLGDQDLDDLRVTQDYQTFVDRYLPPHTRPPRLPPGAVALTISGRIVRLAGHVARVRRAHWQGVARGGAPLEAAALRDEASWWRHLREYCIDARDWSTRAHLIRQGTRSAPEPTEFNPSMFTVYTDRRWGARVTDIENRAFQQRESSGAPAADDQRRVNDWLDMSRALRGAAKDLTRLRDDALWQLGGLLSGCDCHGYTVDSALSRWADREPAALPVRDAAALLAGAWAAVEGWMDTLRDQNQVEVELEEDQFRRDRLARLTREQVERIRTMPHQQPPRHRQDGLVAQVLGAAAGRLRK